MMQQYRDALQAQYPQEEIEQFIRMAFNFYLGWDRVTLSLNREQHLSESELLKFHFCLKDLKKGRPIQYILGETTFIDLNMTVNESVLIPRPETEELVYWIHEENQLASPKVVDIGTGSGAIILGVQSLMQQAHCTGVDVSAGALEVAKQNASRNNLEQVGFQQQDILTTESLTEQFDIIVSNPPYVLNSEAATMEQHVLEHEPHLALFVPDDDPLLFYRKIAALAKGGLKEGGKLYFEINQQYGRDILLTLEDYGFRNIEVKKDLFGNDRMVRGIR